MKLRDAESRAGETEETFAQMMWSAAVRLLTIYYSLYYSIYCNINY